MLKSEHDLSAHSCMNGILLIFYFVPRGFAECISAKIGKLMGKGDYKKAREATFISIFAISFLSIAISILGYFIKPFFMDAFSTSKEMNRTFSNIYSIYVFFYYLIDCF